MLATAFHPELTGDRRLHRLLLQMVSEEAGRPRVIEAELDDPQRAAHRPPGAGRAVSSRPCLSRCAPPQPRRAGPDAAETHRTSASRRSCPRGCRCALRRSTSSPRSTARSSAPAAPSRSRTATTGSSPSSTPRTARWPARSAGRPPRRARRGGRRATTSRASTPPAPTSRENLELFGQAGLRGLRPGGDLVARAGVGAGATRVAALAPARDGRGRRAAESATETARSPGGRGAGRLAPVRPVEPRHAAGDRPHRGLQRGGLGGGRARGDRPALGAQPDPPLRRGERLAPAVGAARRRLRAARDLPRRTALPALPRPRRHRRAGFLRSRAGAHGTDAIGAGILAPVRTYESAGARAAEAAASSRSAASRCWCARSAPRSASRRWCRSRPGEHRGGETKRGTPRDDRRPRCAHGGAAARDRRAPVRSPTGPTCSRS